MKEKIISMIRITGFTYAISFLVTSILFIFYTPELVAVINSISHYVFPTLPYAQEQSQFYKILALSMMSGVTACSFLLYKNVSRYSQMMIPLATMKFVSSLSALAVFIWGMIASDGLNTLANLIIFFTDFPLGAWIFYLYCVYRR
ncbi:MAG: hypothetical protein ACUVRK_08805 [Spirochaetota bacterium]